MIYDFYFCLYIFQQNTSLLDKFFLLMKPQIRNLRWSQNQKHIKKVYSQNQELKETLKLKQERKEN